MSNPLAKSFRYLMALFGVRIDEHADPKVQIQQAVAEQQRQHQDLVRQAAAVMGNQRQLEMRLSRVLAEVEQLQASARQALVLADKARASGNDAEAARYESTAEAFATKLVAAEQSLEDLKSMHDGAAQAAQQAQQAVESNALALQQKLAERAKLLSQLEQAKMQEQVAGALEGMSALTASGNTPSLDEVRDRIERRYANAMGRADLAKGTVESRMLEVQRATLDVAGADRLAAIRADMNGGQSAVTGSSGAQGAIDSDLATDHKVVGAMARLRQQR